MSTPTVENFTSKLASAAVFDRFGVSTNASMAPKAELEDQIKAAQSEGQVIRVANLQTETQEIINEVCTRFNTAHFVAPEGSNVYVWVKSYNPALKKTIYQRRTVPAFLETYRNETVKIPDAKGGYKPVSVAKVWIEAAGRANYPGGMMCCPGGDAPEGVFNTFLGWGVEAIDGDVAPVMEFILHVICSGNKTHAKYLIQWMAFCIQHPATPPGVAVVLVGGKGCGKTTLGEMLIRLHGAHGMSVSDPKFLTGSFNAHMRDLLFLFCDESFWAGDKAAEGTLKARVTGQTLIIEAKGVDAITTPNMLSIMMATNNEHAVPSSSDERRWFVLRVSESKQGDFAYWDTLNNQFNNGGANALLHYLRNLDISGFNIRSVPHTNELATQKIHSLGPMADFIFQCLCEERLCGSFWGDDLAPCCSLFMAELEEYCQRHPRHRYNVPTPQYIGRHLYEVVGALKGRNSNGKRDYTYRFPPLQDARDHFAAWAKLGSDFKWDVA